METAISHSDILALVVPPFREPSRVGRTLRQWFPNWWRPPTDVIVFQHSDGDWDRAHCTGDPIRGWRVTPDGPVEIPTDTEIDKSSVGPWYRSAAVFRFCVSSDFTRIIYSRLHGPRAGSGATYAIRQTNGEVSLADPTAQWRAQCRTTWFLRKAAASSLEHHLVYRFVRPVVAFWFATPRTPPLWQRDFFLVNCSVLRSLSASERSGVVKTFRCVPHFIRRNTCSTADGQ